MGAFLQTCLSYIYICIIGGCFLQTCLNYNICWHSALGGDRGEIARTPDMSSLTLKLLCISYFVFCILYCDVYLNALGEIARAADLSSLTFALKLSLGLKLDFAGI